MRVLMSVLLGGLVTLSVVSALAAGSSGSSGGAPVSPGVQLTPEQLAHKHYNLGLKYKKKARKYEEKALAAADKPKKQQKYLKRVTTQYERMVKNQIIALQNNNEFYQAMSELGYGYRKLGEFKKSIRAYNAALSIKSDYGEALEYRGEAFLAEGDFEASKRDYLSLVRLNPELAAMLMAAYTRWIADDKSGAPEAKEFKSWIKQRDSLAQALSSNPGSLNNASEW